MIFDSLDHLKRYAVPQTEAILKFIAQNNCTNLPDGEIEIDGRQLFVRVMSYVPKPAVEQKFEIHHIYADLQYVVQGTEIMQIAHLKNLSPSTEYDAQGDYQFFKAPSKTTSLIVKEGEFAVFYPKEPHRPACLYEGHVTQVKKLVFKIKID